MLLAIRERLAGVFLWVIIILITCSFAFFGVQEYLGLGGDPYAVKVNDDEISLNAFDRELSQNRQYLIRSLGGQIPDYFDANTFLRKQTLDNVINRSLVESAISDFNYRIDPIELVNTIRKDSRFQKEGEFSNELYEAELRSVGLSKRRYEEQLARQILTNQIQQGIQATAFTPEQELLDYARRRYQTRSFDYIELPLSAYEKDIAVSNDEVQAYYDKNADKLLTEEQLSIEYVELSLPKLASQVVVDEETLKSLYAEGIESGSYKSEEVRNASHILIKLPTDANEDVVAEKRAESVAILTRLQAGEDFAELAKAESADPGSAAQGGSLGDVRRGVMVKPFETALFALKDGELSEPVKTRFGFHIIKVNQIKPSEVQPYEEVRVSLEQDYRNKQAESVFYDKADVLATLSFENPASLDAAAEGVEIAIKQTPLFSRGSGVGVAADAKVRDMAFSDSVLLENNNSEPVEIAGNHLLILRIKEHLPSRVKTIEEANAELVSILRQQKAEAELDTVAEKVMAEMPKAQDLPALSKSYSGEYKNVADAKRDDSTAPGEIVQAVFRLPVSKEADASETPIKKVVLSNGNVVLVKLNEAKPGDLQWLQGEERIKFKQQLEQGRGRYGFTAMLDNMKSEADISINPELQ